MKRFLLLGLLMMAASCSPQAFSVLVDKRQVPESGLDLVGKSVCLVYVKDSQPRDSIFSGSFCDGFAQGLESQLFDNKKAVEVFSLGQDAADQLGSKDDMVKLVMETNSDVVFILDKPMLNRSDDDVNSCIYTVYAYDSMSKNDEVKEFRSSSKLTDTGDDMEMFASDAQYLGFDFSKKFAAKWEKRQYSFIYFDSVNSAWMSALEAVCYQDWHKAIDTWMPLAESDESRTASCASYNIAVACHLLGDNKLAAEWLDHSDSLYPVSLSSGLRTRIEAELKSF